MATKKIEEYTTEELKKIYRTLSTVFKIEATIAVGLVIFIVYNLATHTFKVSPAINFLPLMFVGVMVGPWVSMNKMKKELEKRGETV
ncbi:MAG: hypothetical protein MUF24_04790 [Chitinophagaceae bacterium]|jgi:uncharacterized protein YneF (UPF0154 family)|nr:hypothetical protein [Chitinophagaceae bacterium]